MRRNSMKMYDIFIEVFDGGLVAESGSIGSFRARNDTAAKNVFATATEEQVAERGVSVRHRGRQYKTTLMEGGRQVAEHAGTA